MINKILVDKPTLMYPTHRHWYFQYIYKNFKYIPETDLLESPLFYRL